MEQKNSSEVSVDIIVIDNHSPNGSGEKLKELYEKDNNIKIILLKKNIGFSRANNIGYKFAKKNNPDLIMMSNNDIIIEDINFIDKLYAFYKKNISFYIISPDIVDMEGHKQNPLREKYISKKASYKMMYRNLLAYFKTFIPVLKKNVSIKEQEQIEYWLNKRYNERTVNDIYNFVPFGAFIIYTKKWIENEEIAFPSDTFMFTEEDHLSYYIKIKKYSIIYNDTLQVRHLDSNSLNSIGDLYKKIRFRSKNIALARRKYIKFLKKSKVSRNNNLDRYIYK